MPSSVARRWWRSSMLESSSSWVWVMAASRRRSSRSVMPETAECTSMTRAPPWSRSRVTAAMLRQLVRLETLVPPNFSTIQADGVRATGSSAAETPEPALTIGAPGESWVLQLVVEVFEVFLELLVRQDLLQAAPGGLAALALRAHALIDTVQQTVVLVAVLGGTAQ